jgi:sorbitol-6-phosphate 2-dehydrogenase
MNTQLINIIAPALRGLLSTSETLKLITFHAQHSAPAPLVFETANDEGPKKLVDRLRTAINAHKTAPSAVHVKNLGYFTAADPPTTGRGLEIAQHLATQGAHVALADVNIEGARKAAADINSQHDPNRALGLSINVADPASVDSALHELVKNFGGLDILISNAGVLRAGSVKTLSDKDFDLSTNVNYKGYFLCVQKSAPIMATQRLAKPDTFFDIIQINSKSGLQGSNRNGAYAGSKFGGIGLTQSFALELIEDNIKVNSICPGNFFDGPLWSDPTNGLFVQYLRTGKVPGAKTIEDVKKSYESKVPMNRGCRTADVMTAIYYLIEQKYETGQALPVTGGQVMLS